MNRYDRREFLGKAAGAAALLHSSNGLRATEKPPDVVEVSGTDRKAMVKAALESLGGMQSFVKKGAKVVLKPNLAFANPPDWATGTHPDTLIAVAQACLEAGAKEVLVLEYPLNGGQKCLERTGAAAALKALPDVKVRMLEDDDEFREVTIPKGISLTSTDVAKKALDADVLINLPQAKHHGLAGVSFGLKNAMGLILSRKRFHVWLDLHQAIADLNLVVRPHLTLLDATHVLLDGGPRGPGTKASPGKMYAGRAIASVDACALSVAPFDKKPMTLEGAKHIALAGRHGLGECDVTKIALHRVAT